MQEDIITSVQELLGIEDYPLISAMVKRENFRDNKEARESIYRLATEYHLYSSYIEPEQYPLIEAGASLFSISGMEATVQKVMMGESKPPTILDKANGVPCPHCGSKNTITKLVQERSGDEAQTEYIDCDDCGQVTKK